MEININIFYRQNEGIDLLNEERRDLLEVQLSECINSSRVLNKSPGFKAKVHKWRVLRDNFEGASPRSASFPLILVSVERSSYK